MAERAYLDWNATAPLRPEARAAMVGGARPGRQLRPRSTPRAAPPAAWSRRRARRSPRWSAPRPKNVIFTSGGTEANMLALTPALEIGGRKEPRDRLLVSAIEHPSVRSGGRFAPDQVEDIAGRRRRRRRSRRAASARLPTAAAAARLGHARQQRDRRDPAGRRNRRRSCMRPMALLHVDAVQAPGRIDCDIDALGADLLSCPRTRSAARRASAR